jgi:class 3 adenylate cyclase
LRPLCERLRIRVVEEFLDVRYARPSDGAYIAYVTMGEGAIDFVPQIDYPGNIDLDIQDPLMHAVHTTLATFGRVVIHERRATGLSSRNVEPPNLETRVSDLAAVLHDAGSDQPVVLIAPYESGAVTALFAATYPEKVSALAWFEPTARSIWTPDYPWGFRPDDVDGELASLASWGTLEYGRAFVANEASRGNIFPDGYDRLIALEARNTCTPDVALEIARIWFETDVRAVLPAVQAPALLFTHEGRKDAVEQTNYVASLMPRAEVRLLPGVAWTPEELRNAAQQIGRFVGAESSPIETDTVLSTILFTDIVGSTEKQVALGDHAWKELIERHHSVVRQTLKQYRGIENDTAGDGFYATFDGPARAIKCAQEIRRRIHDLGLEIRAGIHTGECEVINDKVGGIAVTIGSRIASMAGPSDVLISQTVKDLVAGSGLTLEAAGEHELKGVPDRWRLYRVSAG